METYDKEYEERMRQAEEDLNNDDYEDEIEEPDTPDYYECLGCIKTFARKPIWGQCPHCGSIIEEGFY